MGTSLSRVWRTTLPIIVLLALLAGSLVMMTGGVIDAESRGRYHLVSVGLNVLLLLIVLGLIGVNLFRLIAQRMRNKGGSRLALRLAGLLVVFTLAPAAGVYAASAWMLDRGIESWFSVGVEQALADALALSRHSLDTQINIQRAVMEPLARELQDAPDDLAAYLLDSFVRNHPRSEMLLLDEKQRVIAVSGERQAQLVPDLPSDEVLLQARQASMYAAVDPVEKRGLYIRLVVALPSLSTMGEQRFLQMLYPLSERANTWAVSVQNTFQHYDELTYLREALRNNFILVLSLVLLLGVLYAIWVAMVSARNLAQPLAELTEATSNIARGDLNVRLSKSSRDEMGQLVDSFNNMASGLTQARDLNAQNQQQLEEYNLYLDTVLDSITSGVLGLDKNHVVKKANPAASRLLKVDWGEHIGEHLFAVDAHPLQKQFCTMARQYMEASPQSWQERMDLVGEHGHLSLLCLGKAFADGDYVLVFNDITQVEQAQRETVWSEVARRLAHEIKNPLTPIQLSAEHLAHKLRRQLPEEDARFVERSVHTIIEQVKAMRRMVDEFSQYSRPAKSHLVPLSFNEVIREVMDLYRGSQMRVHLHEPDGDLWILGDAARLRQLLHNLLKNAEEAVGRPEQCEVDVTLASESASRIRLEVKDCGPGFESALIKNLFEPYATTKPTGKGLGLAIVKKIVEEHQGTIQAMNPAAGGAQIMMEFPRINKGADA